LPPTTSQVVCKNERDGLQRPLILTIVEQLRS
jgi:hypothetical protein